ncbi:MAG: cupin domain-containing protein [Firmicutes bacterium]|mgnify:CR=1 FL=1|nr:cupin domain-containing protein [Bacillota bacterium]
MIRETNEMELELREKMRGGSGTVRIKHIFKADELKGKARMLAEITLPVGGSIGFHKHDQEEEIFYFISGKGRVDDQGIVKEVKAGDAVLTGGGNGHAVENTGEQPLLFLALILLYD